MYILAGSGLALWCLFCLVPRSWYPGPGLFLLRLICIISIKPQPLPKYQPKYGMHSLPCCLLYLSRILITVCSARVTSLLLLLLLLITVGIYRMSVCVILLISLLMPYTPIRYTHQPAVVTRFSLQV